MPSPQTHLNIPAPVNVSRSESLKSERSDRRVSFNRDVGIKHIPKGQKRQAPLPPRKDEWDLCTPVHKSFEPLTSKQLAAHAEELVNIVNQIECKVGSDKDSQSLDRRKNNTRVTNKKSFPLKLAKRNNLSKESAKSTPEINKKTNNSPSILKKTFPRNNRQLRRSVSVKESYAFDSTDSESAVVLEKNQVKRYKSEPDLPKAAPRKNKKKFMRPEYQHSNSMPAPSIWKDNQPSHKYQTRPSRGEYKSADNLTDLHIPQKRRIQEYKSADNLQSGYSSSDLDMNPSGYRKSNAFRQYDNDYDRPYGMRNRDSYHHDYKRQNSHNDNKPFSYLGGSSLSSVSEVRKISPTREIPIYREEYEKDNRRTRRSLSPERELNNGRKEDYSTKIIITSDPIPRYDDDDAYETFQVGDGGLSREFRSLGISNDSKFNEYRRQNNNMNISSIGVQTESIPKPPLRTRRSDSSSQKSSQRYDEYSNNNELSSTSLVRRVDHNVGRNERSVSPPTRIRVSEPRREVVPLLSDTDESEYYHRNKDPLAKIRSQVKLRKLQEEREARERGEYFDNYYEHERKNKLQPLTVDEVDKLEFEIDENNKKSLLVAREHSPHKYYDEQSPPLKKTDNINRDNNYLSRKDRENIRTPSTSRDKSPSGFFSTLDRMKKGAAERGRNMLGRKDNKPKKKNKKIKIKFFYEPTNQNQNEDPLSRYTEYKGASSDEKASPVRHQEFYVNNHHEYPSSEGKRLENRPRENSIDRREISIGRRQNSSDRRENSVDRRENVLNRRENTINVREKSLNRRETPIERRENSSTDRRERNNERNESSLNRREHDVERRREYRDISCSPTRNNRYVSKGAEERDSYWIRNRRDSSTERNIDTRPIFSEQNRYDYEAQKKADEYRSFEREYPSNDYKVPHKREREFYSPPKQPRHVYDSEDDKPMKNHESRNYFEHDYRNEDNYRNRSRSSSPMREVYEPKTHQTSMDSEGEDKKNKMMRQRKKFFGVLRGEGRTKPNKPAPKPFENSGSKSFSNSLSRTKVAEEKNVQTQRAIETSKNKAYDARSNHSRETRRDDLVKKPRQDLKLKENRKEIMKAKAPSSRGGTPMGSRENLRYYGDKHQRSETGSADYRSLPNRKPRSSTGSKFVMGSRRNYGPRRVSPGARGSAGSSLQSSESEADSQGGSHASRASRASRVSTSSNRSVYLHATAVADIPVRRESDDGSHTVNRQAKKVNRSFSLSTPWKPKHYRDHYELDYDNPIRGDRSGRPKNALPPRPPRKVEPDDKSVNRSKTIYKDSKLSGWLKKKKSKEPTKGI